MRTRPTVVSCGIFLAPGTPAVTPVIQWIDGYWPCLLTTVFGEMLLWSSARHVRFAAILAEQLY